MTQYILALDQGTTSSRAILFDHEGKIAGCAAQEFPQHFPQPGWVEHDPNEIWNSQLTVARKVLQDIDVKKVRAIGITNQRETTVVWDRKTGEPIAPAIVWQDRRTADYCEELRAAGKAKMICDATGLELDAYFSATKLKWILDQVPGARERARKGALCFGTIDSWLAWKLCGVHVTDVSNASRTMLFNIHLMRWDSDLLQMFDIPEEMLPQVVSSSEEVGTTRDAKAKTAVIEARFAAPEIRRALAPGARLPFALYRMEGKAKRSYLAFSPPRTTKPNFHVPDAFATLVLDAN